jgi:tellurite resistance protein TehA-like permease
MLRSASVVVIAIWSGEYFPEYYFKTVATLFITGLASFLIWSPIMVYRFLKKL